jgi:hypothetical protein
MARPGPARKPQLSEDGVAKLLRLAMARARNTVRSSGTGDLEGKVRQVGGPYSYFAMGSTFIIPPFQNEEDRAPGIEKCRAYFHHSAHRLPSRRQSPTPSVGGRSDWLAGFYFSLLLLLRLYSVLEAELAREMGGDNRFVRAGACA